MDKLVQVLHEGKTMARRRNRVETAKKKRKAVVPSKKSDKFFKDAKSSKRGLDRYAIKQEDRVINSTFFFDEDAEFNARDLDKVSRGRKPYEAPISVNYDIERYGFDA